jgi:hypothetical protein
MKVIQQSDVITIRCYGRSTALPNGARLLLLTSALAAVGRDRPVPFAPPCTKNTEWLAPEDVALHALVFRRVSGDAAACARINVLLVLLDERAGDEVLFLCGERGGSDGADEGEEGGGDNGELHDDLGCAV